MFGFTVIVVVLIACIFETINNFIEKSFKEKSEWSEEVIKNHEQRIRQLERILEMEGNKK